MSYLGEKLENRDKLCYELLLKVYRDGAYAGLELDKFLRDVDENMKGYITKLFYGVLDESVQFDYIIGKMSQKKPQLAVVILIKMGLYLLEYMRTPSYAVVDNIVNLAKSVGKAGASGFINAILRNYKNVAPPQDKLELLSYTHSFPLWLVKILARDYGFAFTESFLAAKNTELTHIRVNTISLSVEEFEKKYPFIRECCTQYGYYVTHSMLEKLSNCHYIVQSLASMIAVNAYICQKRYDEGSSALDVCAAPGGKAVYLYELTKMQIRACDVHAHRVELIRGYAQNTPIKIEQNDATIFREEWANLYDLVICDAPCSGIGVVSSKPDILLNRKSEDIATLSALQSKILAVSAKYVKLGGILCYSTCTVLRQENEQVAQNFLANNPNFCLEKIQLPFELHQEKNDGYIKLYPQINNTDGFFVARFKRIA